MQTKKVNIIKTRMKNKQTYLSFRKEDACTQYICICLAPMHFVPPVQQPVQQPVRVGKAAGPVTWAWYRDGRLCRLPTCMQQMFILIIYSIS